MNLSHPRCPEGLQTELVDILATDPSMIVRQHALLKCAVKLSKVEDYVSLVLRNQQQPTPELQCLEGMIRGDIAAYKWYGQVAEQNK